MGIGLLYRYPKARTRSASMNADTGRPSRFFQKKHGSSISGWLRFERPRLVPGNGRPAAAWAPVERVRRLAERVPWRASGWARLTAARHPCALPGTGPRSTSMRLPNGTDRQDPAAAVPASYRVSRGLIKIATMLVTLIIGLIAGPAVSL